MERTTGKSKVSFFFGENMEILLPTFSLGKKRPPRNRVGVG